MLRSPYLPFQKNQRPKKNKRLEENGEASTQLGAASLQMTIAMMLEAPLLALEASETAEVAVATASTVNSLVICPRTALNQGGKEPSEVVSVVDVAHPEMLEATWAEGPEVTSTEASSLVRQDGALYNRVLPSLRLLHGEHQLKTL